VVRLLVIDDASSWCIWLCLMQIALAQRMIDEEADRLASPFGCVAALVRGSAMVITLRSIGLIEVLVACTEAPLDELGATWIGTRLLRSSGHAGRVQGTTKSAFGVGMDSHAKARA
jgi:hypothetical protein